MWRDEITNQLWLASAPLIEMLDETPPQPSPLTWKEQRRLFAELPPHLERMALFAVNTGQRNKNVCGLRWDGEVDVLELGCNAFAIPKEEFKAKRPHVVILNDVARSVVESCRGMHADYVFTYKNELTGKMPTRVETINNTAWQKARARPKLDGVRVHDLRHTSAQRLRQAGIAAEDWSLLPGHATADMADHYATATIARLIEMANAVLHTHDPTTVLRVTKGR